MKKNDKSYSESAETECKEKKIHHNHKEHDLNSEDQETQEREKTILLDSEPQVKEAVTQSELEKKLSDLTEKYIRLLAEYDNYRKRTSREFEFVVNTATEKLVSEFLPILDNLDRATEHRNNKTTYEDYVKGIILIEDQLRAVLERAGLESLEVIGKKFDPAVHSAVMQVESDKEEQGTIIAEAEKGYSLNGKIIRHPKVVVSKQKGKESNNK